MSRPLVFAAAIWCSLGAMSFAQSNQSGAIDARILGSRGYGISIDQEPLSRGSSLQLYAPGWKQGYYSSRGERSSAQQRNDSLILSHTARKVDFSATQTVHAVGDNHLEMTLKGKLTSNVDARMEWGIGIFNAFALYGGSVARGGSDAFVGIIPEPASKRDPESLIGQTGSARIITRFGRINIKVEQGPPELVLLDGRRNPSRGWTQEQPSMWLGMLSLPLKPGQAFEYRVSIEFQPRRETGATTRAKDVTIDARSKSLKHAFVPQTQKIHIIPAPKEVKWNKGRLKVGPKTLIVIGQESARPAGELLAREVKERFGWDWSIKLWKDAPPGAISIAPVSEKKPKSLKPESYHLDCDGKSVVISGTEPGYRYAVQTLLQMFQLDSDGVSIPAVAIDDYPSLAFRGVHLFTGKDSVDFYRKLADRVLARFKFNHVVLECDYTQWDTDKQIWIDQSVPKSQVKQYVKISRDAGLEPIPLVQSLGHSDWMFRNKQNLDLAEDPQTPYAYAVTNPKTYDFIRRVYQEAIELFDTPKYFHIGHDEVDMLGRYPQREDAKKLGKTKLFGLDVNRLESFFKPKGITMMLWGDMLLSKQEVRDGAANAPDPQQAKQRRDSVPKDAVICDWHYQPHDPADFNSLKIFKDAGFKTIACTWYDPQNIYDFAAAARMYKAWGLLQTTWAGYHITQDTLDRESRQFSAYVLAAEYAWNGNAPKPEKLPWRPEEVLARAMGDQRESTEALPGETLSIGGSPLDEFLGYANLLALSKPDRIGGIQFDIDGARILSGRLLSQPGKYPRQITFKTHFQADQIAFLHASAFPASGGAVVGKYVLTYADGKTQTIELQYGRDIRAWTDLNPTAGAPAGWFGKSANGLPSAVRVLRWHNPWPDKTVTSISLSSDHPYASPVLMGVTALQPAASRLAHPRRKK
jgi:hypothetical protein